MFFMAKVTPDIEWSLRMGRPITIEHSRVRIFDRRMFAEPQRTASSSYPAWSVPKQRMRLGSVLMERPQTSRSSRLRSQMTMLPALMPACCSRSTTARISAKCVQMPLPPRPLVLRPMTLSGPRSLPRMSFQASTGLLCPVHDVTARSSRAITRFWSSWPGLEYTWGSRATTTRDLSAVACGSGAAARLRADCEPSSRAPVAASFRNCLRFFIEFLASFAAACMRPLGLQFRFHAARQRQQRLRCVRRGLIGNNAYQRSSFAEDDALRIGNARIAQLDRFRVFGSGFQNLASPVCAAHGVHVHGRLQLALIFVVGGRSGDNAG